MAEWTNSFIEKLRTVIEERRLFHKIILPKNADPITSRHPIGKAFEELFKHPLAKRFLRRKPTLYMWKPEVSISDIPTGSVYNNKIILSHTCAEMPPRELKALLAHEIGHAVALHAHFRGIGSSSTAVETELLSEKIAVVLSGDPEACKRRLLRLVENHTYDFDNSMGGSGDRAYPSPRAFIELIDRTAERMKTPEGKREVEEEVAKQILAEHKKLFPHHFNRPSPWGNTRA